MTVLLTAPLSDDEAIQALYEDVRTVTAGSTGNHTLTVAEMIQGVYEQADGGAAANITTPAASALVAAVIGAKVGTSFEFVLCNLDAGDAMTVVGGSGVTVKGTAAVSAVTTGRFLCVFTNVTSGTEAAKLYRTA